MSLCIILAIGLLTVLRNVLLVSTATTSSSRTGDVATGPAPFAAQAYRPIPAAARVIAARPAKGAGPIAAVPVRDEDVVAVLTSKTLGGNVSNPIANMVRMLIIEQ